MNLLEYITSRYPNAIVRQVRQVETWQVLRAVWRGDRKPSFGLAYRGGRWKWCDFTTGQHGDFADYLQIVEGLPKNEAYRIALGDNPYRPEPARPAPAPLPAAPTLQPASTSTVELYNYAKSTLKRLGMPETMRGRGFTKSEALEVGLGRINDDTLIPITRNGVLMAVKRRLYNSETGKYRYVEPGCGSPAWWSPNIDTAREIVIVEGEFSGMAVYFCLRDHGFAVIGMAGAGQSLHQSDLEVIADRRVYVLADDDQAGHNAMLRWTAATGGVGLRALGKMDACEVQFSYGRAKLVEALLKRIAAARTHRKNSKKQTQVAMANSSTVRGRALECGVCATTAQRRPISATAASNAIRARQARVTRIANRAQLDAQQTAVLSYLEDNGASDSKSLATILAVQDRRARQVLQQMVEAGLLMVTKNGKMIWTIEQRKFETEKNSGSFRGREL